MGKSKEQKITENQHSCRSQIVPCGRTNQFNLACFLGSCLDIRQVNHRYFFPKFLHVFAGFHRVVDVLSLKSLIKAEIVNFIDEWDGLGLAQKVVHGVVEDLTSVIYLKKLFLERGPTQLLFSEVTGFNVLVEVGDNRKKYQVAVSFRQLFSQFYPEKVQLGANLRANPDNVEALGCGRRDLLLWHPAYGLNHLCLCSL